jgi:DNA-binding transcriptional ArsR family regulator
VRHVVYALAEITEQLTEAHLLKGRKEGLLVFYAIADPLIYQLCELVCGSLEKRLTEQAEAFGPR